MRKVSDVLCYRNNNNNMLAYAAGLDRDRVSLAALLATAQHLLTRGSEEEQAEGLSLLRKVTIGYSAAAEFGVDQMECAEELLRAQPGVEMWEAILGSLGVQSVRAAARKAFLRTLADEGAPELALREACHPELPFSREADEISVATLRGSLSAEADYFVVKDQNGCDASLRLHGDYLAVLTNYETDVSDVRAVLAEVYNDATVSVLTELLMLE